MPYIKGTWIAGKTIEVEKKFSSRYGAKVARGEVTKATPEEMELANERHAVKKLTRLINANFIQGDIHLTLTYKKGSLPNGKEQAKKDIEKFTREMRAAYRKAGYELKYIWVAEWRGKRLHYHFVINYIDPRVIQTIWKQGYIDTRFLDETGQYSDLAQYLIKETKETFRDKDTRISGKRWNPSRNLVQPVCKTEVIQSKKWVENPKPPKGYYLEKDSLVQGINEHGYPYQFYRFVQIVQ